MGAETLSALEQQLRQLRVEAARQQEAARAQRQQQAAAGAPDEASEVVRELRQKIAKLEEEVRRHKGDSAVPLFVKQRQRCENLIKRKLFVVPAFEIYGGAGGLYDYGPPGCALKCAVEAVWRSHFVLEEDMLEVSGPCLTPHVVLKTSGHVDRFTDFMVKDVKTQECLRADKYLEETVGKEIEKLKKEKRDTCEQIQELELIKRQADAFSADELHALFQRFNTKSPSGNELSRPFPFNLMFSLRIGPKEEEAHNNPTTTQQQQQKQQQQEGRGYLRPETAQGIFVNFRRLYEFVGGRLPFAAAQIGLGFRNEIAPRNGLLRAREFVMAEIEHFCHPEKKNECPKFAYVSHLKLPLFPREAQLGSGALLEETTLEEAVTSGVIANKTLAYFLARTFLFLNKVGIQTDKHVRFRQHLQTEMAHYAVDCWDAEVETAYGWIEVAGHADRAAFDLGSHSQASHVDLVAMERCDPPLRVSFLRPVLDKKLVGAAFKQQQAAVARALEALTESEKETAEKSLEETGRFLLRLSDSSTQQQQQQQQQEGSSSSSSKSEVELTRAMVRFEQSVKTVGEKAFTPSVIEPSFGIGRILHCILEHAYVSRELEGQEERVFMRFKPLVAPIKVVLLPLSNQEVFTPLLQLLKERCIQQQLSTKTDSSGASVGRRYARADELGVPFALTVDFLSLEDKQVTLRERDSMQQVRLPVEDAPRVVAQLCREETAWDRILETYPVVQQAANGDA
ncbi:hypothetical protein Esti_001886 [Eimeria stiedai]